MPDALQYRVLHLNLHHEFCGLDHGNIRCENSAVSAIVIGEKGETILPADVCEPAGLRPGDQLDWRFEDGEIRGRKLTPQPGHRRIIARRITKEGALVADTNGLTIDPEAIARAVREERDR